MEYRIPRSIETEVSNGWCPGCGHGIVARLIAEAVESVGQMENTLLVEDVACGHFENKVMFYNNLNCAHGRTIVAATGVKRAQPESVVIAHCGDGAAYSIGIESTIYSALRNENILAVVANNSMFGMTGGQMSPTTLPGMKAATAPYGRDVDKQGHPFDVVKTLQSYDIAYLARGSVSTPANIVKTGKMLKKALEKQLRGEGFCLVEILVPCPTNWNMEPTKALEFMKDSQEKFFEIGEFVDKGETK